MRRSFVVGAVVVVLVAGGAAFLAWRGGAVGPGTSQPLAASATSSASVGPRPPFTEVPGYPRTLLFRSGFEQLAVRGGAVEQAVALAALFPAMPLRRLKGTQDPKVNTGEPAQGSITVPARDALILVSP